MHTRETEIRHLSSADVYKLAQILDLDNKWRKLMAIIPKDFEANSEDSSNLKYNNDHVRLVENASIKQNRMATEILLEEWGTSGRKRPTLGVLLELLIRAGSYRAADFVAMNFLNEPPPPRPATGPARRIDISIPLDSEFVNNVEEMLNDVASDYVGTETLNDNARSSNAADNNIDYYEKYHPNQKNIELPQQSNDTTDPSPNNAVATTETDSGTERPEQTTSQSDFIKFSASGITNSQVIPHFSELLPSSSNHVYEIETTTNVQSMEIPMLSVLNVNTQQVSEEVLPNLSALNVEDAEMDFDRLRPPDEIASILSSSSVSSLSSTGDDDDLSPPNLSILDQRSSNNDSSLTNVTGTSEENSFEISMNEGSTSNDNIPCLSALNERSSSK